LEDICLINIFKTTLRSANVNQDVNRKDSTICNWLKTVTGNNRKQQEINPLPNKRELSSVGSEHLPYMQRVIGSIPKIPTKHQPVTK
jgi:hypothetical protein